MSLARHVIALIAAALQLTLPLAAYARTPFVPGAGDLCSVNATTHRSSDTDGSPLLRHGAHCAMCAHGAPPALPSAQGVHLPPIRAALESVALVVGPQQQPVHFRANARAPPPPVIAAT